MHLFDKIEVINKVDNFNNISEFDSNERFDNEVLFHTLLKNLRNVTTMNKLNIELKNNFT